MSHNIETIPGATSSFISARENAWHRLGTVVPETFDALTGMQTAHLAGWNVRKLPLIAHELTLDGITTINALERYMTVRTNPVTGQTEYLGDVGGRYTVVQNEEHAEFLDLLVAESGAHFETMGSLGHGNRVFMSLKMPSHINVGGDVTDMYLIAQNSHDGSTQFEVCISPIRPVCQNTVTLAFKGAPHKYQVRHTASIRGRVQDAREVLDMTFAYSDRYAAQGEDLLAQSFTDADFDAFLLSLYSVKGGDAANASTRTQNVMAGVKTLWQSSPTLESTAGTRFGALQAVTEYQTHFAMAQGKTPAEVAQNRAVRDTGVEGDKFRSRALALLSA